MLKLPEMSLDDLCKRLGMTADDAPGRPELAAELSRRELLAQLEAIEAQKTAATAGSEAAKAAMATAEATNRNAKYMLWSVIAAAISAVITAAGVAFNVFSHNPG